MGKWLLSEVTVEVHNLVGWIWVSFWLGLVVGVVITEWRRLHAKS